MRTPIAVSVLALLLTGCGRSPEPDAVVPMVAPVTATPATGLDLAACLAQSEAAPAEGGACPSFVLAALADMAEQCRSVGGELQSGPQVEADWLDVDSDGKPELLIDLAQNYYCTSAASLFSCGSLGCPVSLYSERDGEWTAIGGIDASDAPGLEVMPAAARQVYGVLRGGCAGNRPCEELAHYTWNGAHYERSWLDVRGHVVDWAPDGLWDLAQDTAVLAAPASSGAVLDRYPAGTTVVVLGTARDSDWRYVSPCNACQSGFIQPTALAR